jgi:hypothetical protein
MRRISQALAALFLCATLVGVPLPTIAQGSATYVYSPQFLTSLGLPLANVSVTLYLHGTPHTPPNIIATGKTDASGHLIPGASLIIGSTYDFITTSPLLPIGQFTATAPRQLILLPGPPGPAGPAGATGSSSGTIGADTPNVTITPHGFGKIGVGVIETTKGNAYRIALTTLNTTTTLPLGTYPLPYAGLYGSYVQCFVPNFTGSIGVYYPDFPFSSTATSSTGPTANNDSGMTTFTGGLGYAFAVVGLGVSFFSAGSPRLFLVYNTSSAALASCYVFFETQ